MAHALADLTESLAAFERGESARAAAPRAGPAAAADEEPMLSALDDVLSSLAYSRSQARRSSRGRLGKNRLPAGSGAAAARAAAGPAPAAAPAPSREAPAAAPAAPREDPQPQQPQQPQDPERRARAASSAFEAELAAWEGRGGRLQALEARERFANFLTDRYLSGWLDELPRSKEVSAIRRAVTRAIDGVCDDAGAGGGGGPTAPAPPAPVPVPAPEPQAPRPATTAAATSPTRRARAQPPGQARPTTERPAAVAAAPVAAWTCGVCGQGNREQAAACVVCKRPRPEALAWTCPRCRRPNDKDATVCAACNALTPLERPASEVARDKAKLEAQRKRADAYRRMKKEQQKVAKGREELGSEIEAVLQSLRGGTPVPPVPEGSEEESEEEEEHGDEPPPQTAPAPPRAKPQTPMPMAPGARARAATAASPGARRAQRPVHAPPTLEPPTPMPTDAWGPPSSSAGFAFPVSSSDDDDDDEGPNEVPVAPPTRSERAQQLKRRWEERQRLRQAGGSATPGGLPADLVQSLGNVSDAQLATLAPEQQQAVQQVRQVQQLLLLPPAQVAKLPKAMQEMIASLRQQV